MLHLIINVSGCTGVQPACTNQENSKTLLEKPHWLQWSKSVNEQPSARHSYCLLINHGHLAQHAAEWQSRAMLVSVIYATFRLQISMHFYQQFECLQVLSDLRKLKTVHFASLPFAVGVIGWFWLLTRILWSFLLPVGVHSVANTCKPWDFAFVCSWCCVNSAQKKGNSGLKIILSMYKTGLGCPEHSVLHQLPWFHHHLIFFISSSSSCDLVLNGKWKGSR